MNKLREMITKARITDGLSTEAITPMARLLNIIAKRIVSKKTTFREHQAFAPDNRRPRALKGTSSVHKQKTPRSRKLDSRNVKDANVCTVSALF